MEEKRSAGGIGPGSLVPPALPSVACNTPSACTTPEWTEELPVTVPVTPPRKTVLDSLVGTILSQNTTDTNSRRAFDILKSRFPTWQSVRVAEARHVEDAVKCGGLAEIKVARIRTILNTLAEERGETCMEYLRDMTDEEAKRELSRFKGVGPKTVSCVLMFCLRRAEFPVDTHVWKIAAGLGWVPKSASRLGCTRRRSIRRSYNISIKNQKII